MLGTFITKEKDEKFYKKNSFNGNVDIDYDSVIKLLKGYN